MLTQEKEGMDMPGAYFFKVMNDYGQNYSKAEKECLAVLYAVGNFRPDLYGREFILACDHEPVHWMTYVENPSSRLIKWRLKLKDYQYTFEYKKGKLNKGVEALSGNPTIEKENESDIENTDESDYPESTSNEIPLELEENFIKVLVIHDRSERLKILPITRSKVAKEKDAGPVTSSTSIRQPTTGKITSILKRPILDEGRPKDSLKPSVPRKASFKPVKFQVLKPKQSLVPKVLDAKSKAKVKTVVCNENSEEIYIPPPGSKIPEPNVSGIAKKAKKD